MTGTTRIHNYSRAQVDLFKKMLQDGWSIQMARAKVNIANEVFYSKFMKEPELQEVVEHYRRQKNEQKKFPKTVRKAPVHNEAIPSEIPERGS